MIADDSNMERLVHIDLHGLHVNEAKVSLTEFVLPALPVLRKVVVITGHGAHSQDTSSILKREIMQFLGGLDIRCEENKRNKGSLIVWG